MPEFERQRVFHVFVLVGEVGVEEPKPVTPTRHCGQRENHHIMMGVGDQQKRSLASTPTCPARLRSPVEEQSETLRRRLRPMRLLHLLVCRREPGAIPYLQLLIPGTGHKAALTKDRIEVAQVRQSPHEPRERLRPLVMIPINP